MDFVVRYEAEIEGDYYPVVRFDGSHGAGHRDLLDRNQATIRKDWLPDNTTLAQALTTGIQDIIAHWRDDRADFMRREGLKEL